MSQKTLYIIYNADGTIRGKLNYGIRKLSKSGPESACAACDITHGGLSLSESPKWLDSKKQIEAQNVKVIQWHRDEVDDKLREFVKSNNIRYPAVVLDSSEGDYKTIMTNTDLNACAGDPKALVEELTKRGVISGQGVGSSSL